MQSLRLAVRSLRASPVVTTIAVMSLALGIGANTAIFSLLSSLLFRSLPVASPEQLAMVSTSGASSARQQYSYATYARIREHRDIFDGALAYTTCCGTAILNLDGENYAIDRQFVSGDFFDTLGVRAFRGRMLTPADDVPGPAEGPVAVISHRLWHARFGAREDVVGTRLSINRFPVTVVGVMPPTFFGVEVGRVVDLALPYRQAAQFTASPFDDDSTWLNIMVRLKPGLSVEAGSAALRAVQPQIRAGAMPVDPRRQKFLQDPLALEPGGLGVSALRRRFEQPLLVMFAVATLVLLVACANIGNLLLARGIARRYELSVQIALGASRWRLARQLFIEGVLLSAIGAAIGLAITPFASRLLLALVSTSRAPVALDVTLDWRILLFAVTTTALATILFATAPAFRASRIAPIEVLNAHTRAGGRLGTVSSHLVVAQVVLSLVLVVAAGLFVQTFDRLARVPLGFAADRVLVVEVSAPTVDATERGPLFDRLAQAVTSVPGIVAAGGALNPPIVGSLRGDVVVSAPGTSAPPDAQRISQLNTITPGWMAAYGTGIRAGRDFDRRDTAAAPPVMLVNEAFVRRFAAGREVVEMTLNVAMRLPPVADLPMGSKTIVGVVADTVFYSIKEPVGPTIYVPLSQWDWPLTQYSFYIGVRSTADAASVSRAVGTALRGIHNDLVLKFEPLSRQVDDSLAANRVLAVVSGFFGTVGLLLASLGLYGVASYAVERRRIEIGIRMAIGATPSDIVKMVLSRVLLLVGAGVLVGAGISMWTSTLVGSLLYGLDPGDPATLVVSAVILSGVGAAAGWLPARRASRIDPAEVLRQG
jgi:putative ABC transport system permease protein